MFLGWDFFSTIGLLSLNLKKKKNLSKDYILLEAKLVTLISKVYLELSVGVYATVLKQEQREICSKT